MRRIIGATLALGIVIVCLTANADSYRKGQDPMSGYAAMYCSTMYAVANGAKDTINAPENFKIARFDIWSLDTVMLRMTLQFFYAGLTDSTLVDVNQYSPAGVSFESQWYWKFPVTCERIIMTSGTIAGDADWGACVYLMRYGEGAGIEGVTHPWPRRDGF